MSGSVDLLSDPNGATHVVLPVIVNAVDVWVKGSAKEINLI